MFKKLNWDSDFFGFNTARIDAEKNIEELEFDLELARKNKISLVYLFVNPNFNKIINYANKKDYFKLVDTKITYRKNISNEYFLKHSEITSVNDESLKSYKKELFDLAILSGNKSRFNLDSNISKSKFIELYYLWILNTVKDKDSSRLFVYTLNSKIVGMVTVNIQKNATIGLLAVKEDFQGKSIGKKLMGNAELYAQQNTKSDLYVSTQKNNNQANNFYEKLNYKIHKEEIIYHIWLK